MSSKKKWQLSRRSVLRGLGTAMALPLLDSMATGKAAAATKAAKAPVRSVFIYTPNGFIMPSWTPSKIGENFDLSPTLKPLEAYKKDLLVLSGLALDGGRAHGDGAGDHARSAAPFLTGAHPRKTSGADIKNGISVDQVAAREIGKNSKFASLELGIERGQNAGNCDSGYSCAYSSNVSWRGEAAPVAKETNPRLVFERLFVDSAQDRAARERAKLAQYKSSVLDIVHKDAASLKNKLGQTDKRKLEEYLDGVRSIEKRIQNTEKDNKKVFRPSMKKPAGVPRSRQDHMRIMSDLIVLAFQADVTRVCSFMYGNAGSNRAYRTLGVSDGHHQLSHHRNAKDKVAKIAKIDLFNMEQYAYLLNKLKAVKEGDSNMLDNSMVMLGSGLSDGNRHSHHDLPIVIAGKGGGALKTGRHLRYKRDTPLCNLYLSMLDRMGAFVERFGDSTGRLTQLS
jgi:hypothetical protein